MLRKLLSTAIIRGGSRNPFSRAIVAAACRKRGTTLAVLPGGLEISKDRRVIRLAPTHFVHAPELASHFDLFFSQVVAQREGEREVIDYSQPKLHRYAQSGLDFELSSFPEEQSAIDDYFRWYTPRAGDVVFDLGAYCGVSTYHL